MTLEKLYLEITRQCTLRCEHCLRGDNKNEFMSLQTINSVLKDVKQIDRLLLTGGEPLLAVLQIEEIVRLIKENNIKINSVLIITNGTVLNDRVVKSLKELSTLTNLIIKVSYDPFHQLELDRLNLNEKRKNNFIKLEELFNAEDYGKPEANPRYNNSLVFKLGRAKRITAERLAQINENLKAKIVIDDLVSYLPEYSFNVYYDTDADKVDGCVSVDANGHIVAYQLSFDDEDEEQKRYNADINELGFKKALINYIKFYIEYSRKKQKENEEAILLALNISSKLINNSLKNLFIFYYQFHKYLL